MSTDAIDPMDEVQSSYNDVVAEQQKDAQDHEIYMQRVAHTSGLSGFALAISLLYTLFANYPDQTHPDATMTGFYEDQIAVTGDSMVLMGNLTTFTNGMENQFSDTSGTTADMQSFAHSADEFLDATDPDTGWMTKNNVIPPDTLSAARDNILKMRQDIHITGDDKYNAPGYHLSDDLSDSTTSHSFGELYANAQLADGDKGARDSEKLFTQGFDSVSSIFDGANSSLKLELDQTTNDSKNMTSAMVSVFQGFFKPSDTAVSNSRPS